VCLEEVSAREAAAHNATAERPRPTDKRQGRGIPLHYVLSAEDVALPPGEYGWDRFAGRVGPRRVKIRAVRVSASPSSRMPPHGVYLGGEGNGRQDGRAAPGRHGQQVRVIGHDEHGAYFSGEIQDQVVLVVGAVVNCPGHVSHDSPAAVLGRHPYGAQVSIDLRLGPFEQLGQDPVDVGDDVRGQPERELGGVNDYAQAVSRGIAGYRRR